MWRKTTTRLGDVSTRLERSVIEEKDDFNSTLFYPIQHCVKFVVLPLVFGEITRHTWLGRNPDLDPK